MKFSLKIASSAIGFALFAAASVASAHLVPAWIASGPVVAEKNPEFNMMHLGSSIPVVHASTTPVVASLYVQFVATSGVASSSASCPVVTSFLKMGAANKAGDVLKLQAFLKGQQGLDVDLTGIYDQKTEAAVEKFQRAYMSEIMTPWGATRPSGAVYVTTAKKINQLACGTELALNADEASTVTSYKSAADAAASQQATDAMGASVAPAAPTVTMEAGDNAAAAGHVSEASKFWQFIKSFFQK